MQEKTQDTTKASEKQPDYNKAKKKQAAVDDVKQLHAIYNVLIIFLRCQRQFTTQQMADCLQISEPEYFNIENGYTLPTYAILEQLSIIHHARIDFLIMSCSLVDGLDFYRMLSKENCRPGFWAEEKVAARLAAFENPIYKKPNTVVSHA